MAYHIITIEMCLRSYGFGLDMVCDGDWQSVFAREE